jgi:uncharacterized membrane protein
VIAGALWPIPAAAVALAVVLGIALPALDGALQEGQDSLTLVFSGGPAAARTVLSTIASSLISVTTLLFSLTIVTLQLASSQYSPRLLQTFVRDRVVQASLGTLLGTFVYALVVLRSVRSADESDDTAFVPRLSVTVAFLLTLASVAVLVAFLSHQTRQLRVETMMRDVHAEAARTLRRVAAELDRDGQPDAPLPDVPAHAQPVPARGAGFWVRLAEAPVLDALTRHGVTLRTARRPGEPVIGGTPVAWVWRDDGGPASGRDLDAETLGEVRDALDEHLVLHYEREELDDPSYGLRKLVDIACRALSPGINDPTTAVHVLSHVSALLGLAAAREFWHRRLPDDGGRARLLEYSWDFEVLLDLSVTQVRHYGREDSAVVERLFGLLAEVAWQCRTPGQRAAVGAECDRLAEQCARTPPPGWTADRCRTGTETVAAALLGTWPKPAPG